MFDRPTSGPASNPITAPYWSGGLQLIFEERESYQIPSPFKIEKCNYRPELASFSPQKLMGQLKTVGPGPLGPLAPVDMPKWVAPIGCCKARPSAMVFACGRLWCHGAVGVVARRRLGTRLGLAGGGPTAFAQPEHARAASTQNSGRVGPREPFQQQRNRSDRAVQICESAARACGQPRSID